MMMPDDNDPSQQALKGSVTHDRKGKAMSQSVRASESHLHFRS